MSHVEGRTGEKKTSFTTWHFQEPHPGNVGKTSFLFLAALVAQTIKNLPAMWDTWFHPWVGKIPMATHSNILAWRIPWTEEPGRLQSMGLQRGGHDWATFTLHTHFFYKGRDSLWGEWLETKPSKLFYFYRGHKKITGMHTWLSDKFLGLSLQGCKEEREELWVSRKEINGNRVQLRNLRRQHLEIRSTFSRQRRI